MTSGQVLYRKWRPQTLGEVVGQGPVTQTLLTALQKDRIGHAYLFTGPRGTGKTSTARILAKAINCETNQGRGEPCNTCSSCLEITDGSFLDMIEIDGASNRGIDEIRDLREKIRFMPARGRKKVYIIDEVHMLTEQAFNALLKTLEEPPDHAVFILATTEPHKVPLTIGSRCQRFDFRRVPAADAVTRLVEIAGQEGFHLATDALEVVVKASNGSLRDAANLLEQLALTSGAEASAQDARDLFGVAGSARARGLIGALLARKDLAEALRGLARLQAEGVDMRQIHRELVEELRTLLLLRAGAGEVLDLAEEELVDRRSEAGQMDLSAIRGALGAVASLSLPPGGSPLPLEMAFVEIILKLGETSSAAAPVTTERPERRAAPRPTPPPAAAAPAVPQQRAPRPIPPQPPAPVERRDDPVPPATATPPKVEPQPTTTPRPVQAESPQPTAASAPPTPEAPPVTPPAVDIPTEQPATPTPEPAAAAPMASENGVSGNSSPVISLEELQSRWREIVDGLRGVGSSGNLDAFLRSVSVPLSVDDGTIVIGFYHDFHKQKIEDPKYRHLVEQRISQILGRHYALQCERVERVQPRGHLVRAAISEGAQRVEEPLSDEDSEEEGD